MSKNAAAIRETDAPVRHDVVRFMPVCGTRRVTVMVDAVTESHGMKFVHGVRCTPEGAIDSQAREHAWAFDGTVEVIA